MDRHGAMAQFLQSRNIPIFGIANAGGFADALPGWHPKELMPKCESAIVVDWVCELDPVCAHRVGFFQPVLRTTFY